MLGEALVNGIVVGMVTDLDDPEKIGRVKVRYCVLGEVLSTWARLVVLMGGADRGTLFRPEVDDEVLVAFEQGSPHRPYVLGALWNKKDPPPDMGEDPPKNNMRLIQSRSGHILRFNDKDGEERIELIDKDDKRRLVFDVKTKSILIEAEGDTNDKIEVRTPDGSVEIEAKKGINIVCTNGDVHVESKTGTASLAAVDIELRAMASVKIEANSTMDLNAKGPVKVNGALINLN